MWHLFEISVVQLSAESDEACFGAEEETLSFWRICLLFLQLVDKIVMKHLSDIHYDKAFHRYLADIYANDRKHTAWE